MRWRTSGDCPKYGISGLLAKKHQTRGPTTPIPTVVLSIITSDTAEQVYYYQITHNNKYNKTFESILVNLMYPMVIVVVVIKLIKGFLDREQWGVDFQLNFSQVGYCMKAIAMSLHVMPEPPQTVKDIEALDP